MSPGIVRGYCETGTGPEMSRAFSALLLPQTFHAATRKGLWVRKDHILELQTSKLCQEKPKTWIGGWLPMGCTHSYLLWVFENS